MTSVAQTSERNWDWEQTLQLECIGLLSLQDYLWQWFFYSTVVKQEVAIAIDIVHVADTVYCANYLFQLCSYHKGHNLLYFW